MKHRTTAKVIHQVKGRMKIAEANAREKLTQPSSRSAKLDLQEEIDRVARKQFPKDCFSVDFDQRDTRCQKCLWKEPCRLSQDKGTKRKRDKDHFGELPRFNQERMRDSVNNARKTYRDCYQEVFGESPSHSVGSAAQLIEIVRELKVSVRWYCLLQMTSWNRLYPFFNMPLRYLTNEGSIENAYVWAGTSSERFGVVDERYLALTLKQKMVAGVPVWSAEGKPCVLLAEKWTVGYRLFWGQPYELTSDDRKAAVSFARGKTIEDIKSNIPVFWYSWKLSEPPMTLCEFVSHYKYWENAYDEEIEEDELELHIESSLETCRSYPIKTPPGPHEDFVEQWLRELCSELHGTYTLRIPTFLTHDKFLTSCLRNESVEEVLHVARRGRGVDGIPQAWVYHLHHFAEHYDAVKRLLEEAD
jgi:hypothetical protein